jgi:hypothetical protein
LAGIGLLTGHVYARIEDRRRSREFVAFLRQLDASLSERHRHQIKPGQPRGAYLEGHLGLGDGSAGGTVCLHATKQLIKETRPAGLRV